MKTFFVQKLIRSVWCIPFLCSGYVLANEGDDTPSVQSQSATSKIEVRTDGRQDGGNNPTQQQVTVVVDVAGDQSGVVKDAIEKLEKQLKASKIPEELQRKAIESLRSQLRQKVAGGPTFSGKATWTSQNHVSPASNKEGEASNPSSADEKDAKNDARSKQAKSENRIEIRLPFDRSNPLSFVGEGPWVQAVTLSNSMSGTQKKKLMEAIAESLKQSEVSEKAIDEAMAKVEKTLDGFSSSARFGWGQQPPYRIGIACKTKEEGDSRPGLEVDNVFEDSPAAQLGLKAGDRLLSIDGTPIESHDQIVAAVQKAGEEKRAVVIEATRGDDKASYRIMPTQTAIAELPFPGMMPPMAFSWGKEAWVMPPFPKGGMMGSDAKMQEQIRDAVRDAINAARGTMEEGRGAREGAKKESFRENQNEKHIDQLRGELSELHVELEEIKRMLKKLSEKQSN